MDHGKDHHHVATQHGKKGHEHTDSKHQAEENQAPRAGFQLGQVFKKKLINLNICLILLKYFC